MNFHVGTSGWNYGHWKGVFYPKDVKQRDWLSFYARRLHTLELNVTFYRRVKEETFKKWRETVPADFLFSAKMSRYITHIKRLRVEEESIARFGDGLSALGEKLGVVLVQLPPSLRFDRAVTEDFLALLDPRFRYAVEARNATYVTDPFFQILTDRNIAWCISETAGRFPYHEALTADFAYLRLHGREKLYASSYGEADLTGLRDKLLQWGREAYIYFDNDVAGYAVLNALSLQKILLETR